MARTAADWERIYAAMYADMEELETDEAWLKKNGHREPVVGDVYDPEQGIYGPRTARALQEAKA